MTRSSAAMLHPNGLMAARVMTVFHLPMVQGIRPVLEMAMTRWPRAMAVTPGFMAAIMPIAWWAAAVIKTNSGVMAAMTR